MILAAALLAASAAYGGSSILTPGTSRITSGSSFDFTLNTESLEPEESEAEEALGEYVVDLKVSPSASLSVKEGVGTLNAVTGSYQVTSSELGGISVLHFTVTPGGGIKSDTTYTVSVSVTGSCEASDSFSFIVTADNGQEKSGRESSAEDGERKPEETGESRKSGAPGSGKKSSGGMTVRSGGNASSSSSSAVTYAGSWDNYLTSLSVTGYEFTSKFNTIRDTYFLSIPEDVTELSVNAVPSDSSATVAVSGNSGIPKGRSKIMISVTADDGSVRIYRIYVDRG